MGKFKQIGRLNTLLYELLVALAAKKMNRPVRLALTRSEDMLATNPAPPPRVLKKIGGLQP